MNFFLNSYKKLQNREKWMLLALLLVLTVMLSQQLWFAYQNKKFSLLEDIQLAQEQLIWLEDKRVESQNLRNSGAREYTYTDIIAVVEEVANTTNMSIDTMYDKQKNSVQLHWEGNELSKFLVFMSILNARGIVIDTVSSNKTNNLFKASASFNVTT